MFSNRAAAYLATLERRQHVADLRVVREAVVRTGVPRTDAFLEFHAALAGYIEPAGRDEFVYGIVHPASYWYGALTPQAHEHDGRRYARYADAHPSYEREIDEGGAKRAESFVSFIEQHAYVSEFLKSGAARLELLYVPVSAANDVRSDLHHARVEEVCDRIASVWATPAWCVLAAESSTWLLWRRPDAPISLLNEYLA